MQRSILGPTPKEPPVMPGPAGAAASSSWSSCGRLCRRCERRWHGRRSTTGILRTPYKPMKALHTPYACATCKLNGSFQRLGILFRGVLRIRALLFEVYTRASDFGTSQFRILMASQSGPGWTTLRRSGVKPPPSRATSTLWLGGTWSAASLEGQIQSSPTYKLSFPCIYIYAYVCNYAHAPLYTYAHIRAQQIYIHT